MYATKPSPKQRLIQLDSWLRPSRQHRTSWRTVAAHLGPVLSALQVTLQGPRTPHARLFDAIRAESGHLAV